MQFFIFLLLCLFQIKGIDSPSFDCNKAQTNVEKLICQTPEIAKLDAIMALAFHSINANKKNQAKWLKGRPNKVDSLKEYYINHIKSFIAKDMNAVAARLLQIVDANSEAFNCLHENAMSEAPENQQTVFTLLGIIIDSYQKGKVAGDIETSYDFLIPSGSACYKVGNKKYLFKWCHGKGNHNSNYYFWLLSFVNGEFSVKLLEVETYDTQTKSLMRQKDITAYAACYNGKEVIMTVNCGDVDKFNGKKLSYLIDGDRLELIKQQSTDDYQSFIEATQLAKNK